MRSNVYRLLDAREQAPSAQYPLIILSGLIAAYRLTKIRFAHKNVQKLLRNAGVTIPTRRMDF